MRITGILDLVVIILLATVVLMPRPDATVKPALQLDPERRDRVAELQSLLVAHPDAVEPALEVANIYLDGHRPDWALATADAALKTHPDDYRLHHVRAIAYADRFEGAPAADAVTRAFELCQRLPEPPCGEAARARLSLLKSTLEAVARVDMRNQPYLAKERIFEQLHPVFLPKPKPKAKSSTPQPTLRGDLKTPEKTSSKTPQKTPEITPRSP